jgi:hypothetical protein
MCILDAGILLNLVECEYLMLVKEEHDNCLIAIDNQCVVLLRYEYRFNFYRSMLVEPFDVPVAILMLVECLEYSCDLLHLRWKCAWLSVLLWPVTTCEHLTYKFNSLVGDSLMRSMVLELSHKFLTEVHICEHLGNLVDCVMSTLYLKLLEH